MKITSRFTVAVHTLLVINTFQDKVETPAEFIACSVNVNPVVIRRTMQGLKAAGMIDVKAGSGGARLARRPEDITLFDVYSAVDSVEGDLFHFHENPNPACPVGRNIHAVLDVKLQEAQAALENQLKKTTLADLAGQIRV